MMPIIVSRADIFPDDEVALPEPGSEAQGALLDDEHYLWSEDNFEALGDRQRTPLYDELVQSYDELVHACTDVLGEVHDGSPLRVMDLCAGVGLTSRALLDGGVEIGDLTLVDISPRLLELAVKFLGQRAQRMPVRPVHTWQIDVLQQRLSRQDQGGYDLVVTANAFMHFPPVRQQSLIHEVYELLRPGGVLMLESHFKVLRRDWKQSLIDAQLRNLRERGAPQELMRRLPPHIHGYHHYANLFEAYNWLEHAGFGFFDCVYRKNEIAILAAVR